MTPGCQGAPYFRRYGRELVSKPAISLEKVGGVTVGRLFHLRRAVHHIGVGCGVWRRIKVSSGRRAVEIAVDHGGESRAINMTLAYTCTSTSALIGVGACDSQLPR